ncbi:unnamed protein product [Porites evermanni]|uniref:Helicase superfamily 3 single-stranded DNA/RNA virus domain-containing protein n=1 Tax=Porites evermanni TaxID=104178 RepID=A0ABN8PW92_9CNID|nr:unnamed protein product [Porites evermanni]
MAQFKCPSSVMIAGPSRCGKTTFAKLLLQYAEVLFERPIRKIVYCYGQWQDAFRTWRILVLDDLMRNCSEDERILDLFTKVSHHCDVTCIYLTQNLFPPGKFSRSISLNAHYIIAFNNPRDTLGFRTSAQQAFAGHAPYVCVFSRCHLAAVWLSHVGFTSANTGYPTIT